MGGILRGRAGLSWRCARFNFSPAAAFSAAAAFSSARLLESAFFEAFGGSFLTGHRVVGSAGVHPCEAPAALYGLFLHFSWRVCGAALGGTRLRLPVCRFSAFYSPPGLMALWGPLQPWGGIHAERGAYPAVAIAWCTVYAELCASIQIQIQKVALASPTLILPFPPRIFFFSETDNGTF